MLPSVSVIGLTLRYLRPVACVIGRLTIDSGGSCSKLVFGRCIYYMCICGTGRVVSQK